MRITLRGHIMKCEIGLWGIFRAIMHVYKILFYKQMSHKWAVTQ